MMEYAVNLGTVDPSITSEYSRCHFYSSPLTNKKKMKQTQKCREIFFLL